jgi:diguanylate cyclase (GGDEF)-like protein/PAS domain S-box-containing protein
MSIHQTVNTATKHILVVDDNPHNLQLMTQLLRRSGYQVRIATDGEQAIKSVSLRPTDLILMDINMPGKNGIDTCIELKSNIDSSDIPILFLSALHDTEDKLRAFAAGGIDFITKPFVAEEVLIRIETHLQLYQLQHKLEQQVAIRAHELKESERKYQDLYENSSDMYGSVDAKTAKLIFCNQTLANKLGYSKKEIINRPIFDLYHPDCLSAVQNVFKQFCSKGQVINAELQLMHKNGGKIDVLLNVSAIKDENGQILSSRSSWVDISDKKVLEKKVYEQEKHLRTIVNNVPQGLVILDKNKNIQAYNSLAHEILGMPAESYAIGRHYFDILQDWVRLTKQDDSVLQKTKDNLYRNKYFETEFPQLINNQEHWCYLTHTPLTDGSVVRTFLDITERKRVQQKLKLMQYALDHVAVSAFLIDKKGNFNYVNLSAVRKLGYTQKELEHLRVFDIDPNHSSDNWEEAWNNVKQNGSASFESRHQTKDGKIFTVEINATYIKYDETGNILAFAHDITVEKEHQEQLQYMAYYDTLTNLPNRMLLSDRLNLAMTQAKRQNKSVAIAYLDLDGFKQVNDTFGHEVGDKLLKHIAKRASDVLRQADTIARLGGDEFILILGDLSKKLDVMPFVNRLIKQIALPIKIENQDVNVSVSIGITYYPQEEDIEADQLIRQADQAMYQSKLSGKNRYTIFNTIQDRLIREQQVLLSCIEQGLDKQEFILFYQPKVNMSTAEVIGAEALIRWNHPEQGLLLPDKFLPLITEHSLSISLDKYVIRKALTQLNTWQNAGIHFPISINIGAFTLKQKNFVDMLEAIIADFPRVNTELLSIEILETSILNDLEHVSETIRSCVKFGIEFALDDFGTGYSSLSYLKHLPVTQLKMDQSYVRDILEDPEDLAILDGVINFSHVFNNMPLAEGVESLEHGKMLIRLGCNFAQGYAIARPMPEKELLPWLISWQQPIEWLGITAIEKEEISLLYAIVEHKAWIQAIKIHLQDKNSKLPKVDSQHCYFSRRFSKYTQSNNYYSGNYQLIEQLHTQLHDICNQALTNKLNQQDTHAIEMIPEINLCSDKLVNELEILITKNNSS